MLFARILKWLAGKAGLLVIILAILLAVGWVKSEWARQAQERSEIQQKQSVAEALRTELGRIEADIARQEVEWRAQTAAAAGRLESELRQIDAQIADKEPKWSAAVAKYGDVNRQASEARRTAEEARKKRDALERQSVWWDIIFNRDRFAALEMAKATYLALDGVAKAWEGARDQIAPKFKQSPVELLKQARNLKMQEIDALLASLSPGAKALLDSRVRKQQDIAAVENLVQSQLKRVEQDPRQRLFAAARAKLPAALWILVGLMVTPILIKAFLYGVFAWLVEKLPPIRIIPNSGAAEVSQPAQSSVSVPVEIGRNEELLVQPEFLQSSSKFAPKQTQWLLNPQIPFSSLASGMFALTRIRSEDVGTTRVVVSSQEDPLGEVTVIELPEGAAMVIQPRSLAGVVKHVGVPVKITRHWRLWSLHAWLTLQLRYLVFHGPCKLVLKGCRGVRAERPEPGRPRLINQSATIGFSANLEYKNTRCETCVSYLRGKENLFNDLFSGGPGWFVYEEMPYHGRKAGITGRGLEGLTDVVMKAFGL